MPNLQRFYHRLNLFQLSKQHLNTHYHHHHPLLAISTQFHRHNHNTSNDNPVILHGKDTQIHLLGTMHIAEASATAAKTLIQTEYRKGTLGGVFLELDEKRYHRLKHTTKGKANESLFNHALSILSRSTHNPLAGIVELGISSMYRMLHDLGFASGIEFQTAIQTCEEYDIPLILGDTEMETTLQQLAQALSKDMNLQKLTKLFLSPPHQPTDIDHQLTKIISTILSGNHQSTQHEISQFLNRKTINKLTLQMEQTAPHITQALLHERDIAMTQNLITASQNLPPNKPNIVAIVGLAHVDGISKNWQSSTTTK